MTYSILLTGGMGYVGGRLACALIGEGYKVYCGTRRVGERSPSWLTGMQMVYVDWQSSDSLKNACTNIDCVIHLAGMNEIDSVKDPIAALQANGVLTLGLLNAAIKMGVNRFIYFSTAHVYGAPLKGTINEATITRPIHPYAITHKVAEDFVLSARDQGLIDGVVVRLSNSFGVPTTPKIDRWTLLVNDLCKQAAISGELSLNSSGEQLRDFITLQDVCGAIIHMLKLKGEELHDGLFNLGSGNSFSILEMAQRIAMRWYLITGNKIQIKRPISTEVIKSELNYSCTKLVGTGFRHQFQIDDEIDKTLMLCIREFSRPDKI